jgi:hypothetical protein
MERIYLQPAIVPKPQGIIPKDVRSKWELWR